MNPQTDQPDQQTQQPASPFSALPPPDPLLIAQQQLADTTEKLRRAEQRIIALDAERGKLTALASVKADITAGTGLPIYAGALG